jgi:hypothetical protein
MQSGSLCSDVLNQSEAFGTRRLGMCLHVESMKRSENSPACSAERGPTVHDPYKTTDKSYQSFRRVCSLTLGSKPLSY